MIQTDGLLCDAERTRCEIWTRVMGYHRPVAAWNRGKQQEHADRRQFVEPGHSRAPHGVGVVCE